VLDEYNLEATVENTPSTDVEGRLYVFVSDSWKPLVTFRDRRADLFRAFPELSAQNWVTISMCPW
jgi:hypothetical protein